MEIDQYCVESEKDASNHLQNVITFKKRQYRQEIRKKKLQQTLNQTRNMSCYGLNLYSNSKYNNENQNQNNYSQDLQNNMNENKNIENIYNENSKQISQYYSQKQLLEDQNRITDIINEMNDIVYNFDPNNMNNLEEVIQKLLNEQISEERGQLIQEILKKSLTYFNFHIILKNPLINSKIKSVAIWYLIILTQQQNDQYDVSRKLIEEDVLQTLKILLKDTQNIMFYENMIWLIISLTENQIYYKQKVLEQGFLYVFDAYIKHTQLTQQISDAEEGILFAILDFSNKLLDIHDKIDDEQVFIL